MVTDVDARKAVRQLMQRLDLINAQRLGMAYVLAERDPQEYARWLEAGEKAYATAIQPLNDADARRVHVCAAKAHSWVCLFYFDFVGKGRTLGLTAKIISNLYT